MAKNVTYYHTSSAIIMGKIYPPKAILILNDILTLNATYSHFIYTHRHALISFLNKLGLFIRRIYFIL